MSKGVEVEIISTGEKGIIIKRMDAHSYEILRSCGDTVVLSPKEFKEIYR